MRGFIKGVVDGLGIFVVAKRVIGVGLSVVYYGLLFSGGSEPYFLVLLEGASGRISTLVTNGSGVEAWMGYPAGIASVIKVPLPWGWVGIRLLMALIVGEGGVGVIIGGSVVGGFWVFRLLDWAVAVVCNPKARMALSYFAVGLTTLPSTVFGCARYAGKSARWGPL